MNENWLILHNRFVVERGQGVYAKATSFDHILRDNVFVLQDRKSPMIYLGRADCLGVEIDGNRLYGGNGRIVSGPVRRAVLKDNHAAPLPADGKLPPRPAPPVESIYEWQKAKVR